MLSLDCLDPENMYCLVCGIFRDLQVFFEKLQKRAERFASMGLTDEFYCGEQFTRIYA